MGAHFVAGGEVASCETGSASLNALFAITTAAGGSRDVDDPCVGSLPACLCRTDDRHNGSRDHPELTN